MTAIRLAVTDEIRATLDRAKRVYPTLSDAEILKVGLARLVRNEELADREFLRRAAAYAAGTDYLNDPQEDEYSDTDGTPVSFA
ncbi:hypothetical protein [Microbacterium sp.]|uniref:hypothetical protein n=1 Tax=Microbacterium sp. TaxID=51671 RepID=UPI003C74BD3C